MSEDKTDPARRELNTLTEAVRVAGDRLISIAEITRQAERAYHDAHHKYHTARRHLEEYQKRLDKALVAICEGPSDSGDLT